jgi:hypothetical protein
MGVREPIGQHSHNHQGHPTTVGLLLADNGHFFRSFRATARFRTTAGKNGLRLSYQPCCCLAVISVPYVVSQPESRQAYDGSCQKREEECECEN